MLKMKRRVNRLKPARLLIWCLFVVSLLAFPYLVYSLTLHLIRFNFDKEYSPNVLPLTSKNYTSVCGSGKCLLLMFYSPFCGICASFAPVYDTVGQLVQQSEQLADRVLVSRMNGVEDRRVMDAMGVRGYPTILLFPPDRCEGWVEYEGRHNESAVLAFVAANCPP
ncbi:protein disulfide-isomerase [Angomonas deanei]|uniref:Thioredoxin, putative n=1 Tax=Angomonas deanei TaxID=59799 RepID=A0A7G2C441_9TRYP|nr:protein disulfide-isomerase [Angomonas deanei]CAD2214558.1 Thioredoxin, putative [Angomonas deanei]|eukprot:EPY42645.1 protein disulfide-isomerase [Angomonas deanei]